MSDLNIAEIYQRLLPLLKLAASRQMDGEIDENSHLENDLGLDSVGFLTLGLHLEESFGLDVGADVEAFRKAATVGEMVRFIAQRI